tara:strand:- start:6794 stop:6967 length:174 start_codon:yes stop_codon:yes gene_type:complete
MKLLKMTFHRASGTPANLPYKNVKNVVGHLNGFSEMKITDVHVLVPMVTVHDTTTMN